jgi:hypothetical protein
MNNSFPVRMISWVSSSNLRLFLSFWLVTFLLFLPAAEAGFVSDFTGWLNDLRHSSFTDHINRSHFAVNSLYQFTQLCTWFLYQIIGTHAWGWHLVHVSLQAINCLLLYRVASGLLPTATQGIKGAIWAGCIALCCRAGLSEVIVWEASFHYLLGLLLLLLIVHCLQQWIVDPRPQWPALATLAYCCSTFSIELFYLTPFVCALLFVLSATKKVRGLKFSLQFLLPQLLFLAVHFVLIHWRYGDWLPHINGDNALKTPLPELFAKGPRWLGNEFLLLRFLSEWARNTFYVLFSDGYWVWVFWALGIVVMPAYIRRKRPELAPLLLWLHFTGMLCLLLLLPLQFPPAFLVEYDRYSYFFAAFLWIEWVLLLLSSPNKWLRLLPILLLLVQVYHLMQVNVLWGRSQKQVAALIRSLPDHSDKKVLLLNMPRSIKGIFMISPNEQNEAALMRNLLYKPVDYELIDVAGNNICSFADGAHVYVQNDSTLDIVLNQSATWWWYNDQGAASRENGNFRLEVLEYSLSLTLKGPPSAYLLLFQTGDRWKKVDMSIRGRDQY